MSAAALLAGIGGTIALVVAARRLLVHPRKNFLPARTFLSAILLAGATGLVIFLADDQVVAGLAAALLAVLIAWSGTERLIRALRTHEQLSEVERAAADKAGGDLLELTLLAVGGGCSLAALLIERL